ncbi:MAG: zinc ribbon domain-containing protein [Opitutaceae bacterium]
MPTYEYRCTQCKHTMEAFQSMKDDALVECPECHTPNLVRIISNGSGFIFKGKGFYQTDYKKNGSVISPSGASGQKDDQVKSEGSKPENAKSESSTPENSKTESPKSESTKSESPAGDSAKSSPGEKSSAASSSASQSE